MEEAWRRWFGWSISKSHSWNQCRKRFYYHVVKKFDGDPEGVRAKQLASLSTLDMVRGSVVHSVISEQITQAIMGRPARLDIAMRQAARLLSDGVGKNHERLVEHWNGVPVSEGDVAQARDHISISLTNFCQEVWPQRAECRCLEQDLTKTINPKKVAVDGWNIFVNPDLISESKSIITVTDWKTGERERDADDLLQMSVYAMYAMNRYVKKLEDVCSEVVYLAHPKTKLIPVNRSSIETAKAKILAESKEMWECSGVDYFYPAASIRNCMLCNFATLCAEGKEIVDGFAPAASSKTLIGPSVGTSAVKGSEAVLSPPREIDPSPEPSVADTVPKGNR